MDILHDLWEDVTPTSIKNCWKKSQLISFDDGPSLNINQELETEVSEENEARSLFDVLTNFSQTKPSSSSDNVYENELDEIMDEMAAVVGEVGADDYDAMKSIADNWISMEESDVYMETMREEVEELMDINVLRGFQGIDEEDGDTYEEGMT